MLFNGAVNLILCNIILKKYRPERQTSTHSFHRRTFDNCWRPLVGLLGKLSSSNSFFRTRILTLLFWRCPFNIPLDFYIHGVFVLVCNTLKQWYWLNNPCFCKFFISFFCTLNQSKICQYIFYKGNNLCSMQPVWHLSLVHMSEAPIMNCQSIILQHHFGLK